jgi:hypothetical protein
MAVNCDGGGFPGAVKVIVTVEQPGVVGLAVMPVIMNAVEMIASGTAVVVA